MGERGVKLSGGQRQRIAITHRLSTIKELDCLIVLDDGTHDELLKKECHYAKLWKMQSGGFIGE